MRLSCLSAALTVAALLRLALPANAETIPLGDDLRVECLEPGLWLHVSSSLFGDKVVWSNGLIVASGEGAVLIDTPWSDAQTERLLDWIERETKGPARWAIATHFHVDRMGGIRALMARGVPCIAHARTAAWAPRDGLPVPDVLFTERMTLWLGGETLVLAYPGPAHAPDNFVVWLPSRGLLHGGCMVRSAASKALGNLADADVAGWPAAVERVRRWFGEARRVLPGHGAMGGPGLLEHTRALAKAGR